MAKKSLVQKIIHKKKLSLHLSATGLLLNIISLSFAYNNRPILAPLVDRDQIIYVNSKHLLKNYNDSNTTKLLMEEVAKKIKTLRERKINLIEEV